MKVLEFPTHAHYSVPDDHATSAELMQRSGISPRQLDYWTRTGLLRAASLPNPGSGHLRYYPTTEVAVAILTGELLAGGVGLRAANDHARQLLANGTTEIAGMTIHLPQDL